MNAERLQSVLRRAFSTAPSEILAVYLYGSQARQTATARSDVDLAILYAEAPPATLEGLPRSRGRFRAGPRASRGDRRAQSRPGGPDSPRPPRWRAPARSRHRATHPLRGEGPKRV